MFTRLYSRLAVTMLVLLIALGATVMLVSYYTSERYSLEVTQRINRDIALHAAEDMPLLDEGQVNQVALKELAHHVMFINPIVEVYLLSPEGEVLSHALPYDTVLLDRVDTEPLQQFMQDDARLPIFGDDPRSPGTRKVFSVSPIMNGDETAALLYTVLNGKTHDGLRDTVQASYNLRAGFTTIAGSLALATLAGLLVFALLTRRLRSLMNAVRDYRDGEYQGQMLPIPVSGRGDEIDELATAMMDMSRRIERQFDGLKEVDNARRELIANVSHDLRTPLASMQGYLETMLTRGDTLSSQQKEDYLATAYKHSRRLNELIGELFELAKLESAAMEPDWEEFPLVELVQDLVQDYTLEAAERDIALKTHCASTRLMVYADIGLIHRVLENLMQNALRHTPEGGCIDLHVREEAGRVWLDVSDNGEGIAQRDMPHIFERFYRPDTESTSQGHGLGLAIVKRIIELHRSQVAVKSELNRGTSFSFWLPQPAA